MRSKSNNNTDDVRKRDIYWNDNVQTFRASSVESTQVEEMVLSGESSSAFDPGLMNEIAGDQESKAGGCNPTSSPISGANIKQPSRRGQRKVGTQPSLSASLTVSLSQLQQNRASNGMKWTPSLLVADESDDNTEDETKGGNFHVSIEKTTDGETQQQKSLINSSDENDYNMFDGRDDTSIDKELNEKIEARKRARRLKKERADQKGSENRSDEGGSQVNV